MKRLWQFLRAHGLFVFLTLLLAAVCFVLYKLVMFRCYPDC